MNPFCSTILLLLLCCCGLSANLADAKEVLLSRPRIPRVARHYPAQDLLNCDGANFSQTWSSFRLGVEANARRGYPRDERLLLEARKIYAAWEEVAGSRSGKQIEVWMGRAPVGHLEDFCLYGYATAIFINFRHKPTLHDLLAIEAVLGWPMWPLDFQESSHWPTLSRILPLHLENARIRGDVSFSEDFHDWGREESYYILPTVSEVKSALANWIAPVHPAGRLAGVLGEKEEGLSALSRRGSALRVLVAGHHLGSSMEPFTMLREALRRVDAETAVEAQFHGQRHPKPGVMCQEFGYCNDHTGLDDWFLRYESRFVGTYPWMPHGWHGAIEELAAVLRQDRFLSTPDCVICGGPSWFCAMMRGVQAKPMLLYFAWPLVPMVPESFKSILLWQMQAMARTVEPPTVFVAANWLLAAQFALQMQTAITVLRPHGLYVNQTYAPVPAPGGAARVMVSRCGHWTHSSGVALVEMIWAFHKDMPKSGLEFELVFLSIRFRAVKPILHATYQELAQFYACIFWPWDIMMLLFDELYTMTMPLLVPASFWMRTIMVHALTKTDMNWWHLRDSVGGLLPSAYNEEYPLPALPWIGDESGAFNPTRTAAFWFELTDFNLFPHVTRFESLPDMLQQVRNLDVVKVRDGMRRYNAKTLASSMAFYSNAARELLASSTA